MTPNWTECNQLAIYVHLWVIPNYNQVKIANKLDLVSLQTMYPMILPFIRRLHSWWFPSVNSFKFQLYNLPLIIYYRQSNTFQPLPTKPRNYYIWVLVRIIRCVTFITLMLYWSHFRDSPFVSFGIIRRNFGIIIYKDILDQIRFNLDFIGKHYSESLPEFGRNK